MRTLILSAVAFGFGIVSCAEARSDAATGLEAFKRKDYTRAYQEWKAAAESGQPEAQFDLGLLYAQGLGVRRDLTEAERWYRMSARQGNAAAQYALGLLYSRGWGNPRDEADAIRWFQMANSVDSDAMPTDWSPIEGYGVNRDPKQALYWLRLAAEQGHPGAEFELARFYSDGDGVARDQAQAARWVSAAAAQGYAPAFKEMAERFAAGRGVDANDKRAYFWSTLAFLHGNKSVEKLRAAEAAKLSAADVSAQDRAAEHWKPRPVMKSQQ